MSALIHVKRCLALLFVIATLAACSTNKPIQETQSDLPDNFGRATVTLPGHSEPTDVIYEIMAGQAIFEGDIILGDVDAQGNLIQESELNSQAVVIDGDNYRWPGGVIPYKIEGVTAGFTNGVTLQGEQNIQDAISHWKSYTPIEFVERTTESSYVVFVKGSSSKACYSAVGKEGGRQEIKLMSNGDCPEGSLIHEIGHTVGLWHEQSRADRDTFVTIHYDNVDNGDWWNPFDGEKYNFDKHVSDGADIGEYDYNSIMHYGCYFFSANGKKTITPKDPDVGCDASEGKPITLGQRSGLSIGDEAAVEQLYSFAEIYGTTDFGCDAPAVCKLDDVNNDGMDDIIKFVRNSQSSTGQGDVYVAKSSNGRWGTLTKWHENFCSTATEVCATGDFDRNGTADIITFHRGSYGGSKEVWVSLSNGFTGFTSSKKWVTGFCMQSQEVCMTGDFNDDNYDDIITFHHGAWNGSKHVFVYLSNGSSFYSPGGPWHTDFCPAGEICEVGDVDDDGDDDIISFQKTTGDVYVALSNGSSFGAKQKWHDNICYGKQIICTVGDVSGDGNVDLLAFTEAPYIKYTYIPGVGTISESCTAAAECGDVYVALSNGKSFGESLKRHGTLDHKNATPLVGKISSDRRSDVLFIRDNSYVVLQSTIE